MAEPASSMAAPARDYLRLQPAQNHFPRLRHLASGSIPVTNLFLEIFLREKGSKIQQKQQEALDSSGAVKAEPGVKHDLGFFLPQHRAHTPPLLHTQTEQDELCLCNHGHSEPRKRLPNSLYLNHFHSER